MRRWHVRNEPVRSSTAGGMRGRVARRAGGGNGWSRRSSRSRRAASADVARARRSPRWRLRGPRFPGRARTSLELALKAYGVRALGKRRRRRPTHHHRLQPALDGAPALGDRRPDPARPLQRARRARQEERRELRRGLLERAGLPPVELGLFRTDATYEGEHGMSLRLDGSNPGSTTARWSARS
jgi:hypothetical protein